MDKIRAEKLLEKYKAGTLTPAEQALLESWYLSWPVKDHLDLTRSEINNDLHLIRQSNPFLVATHTSVKLWPRFAAAASLLVFLSLGGYFWLEKRSAQEQTAENMQQTIAPGSSQATLTLANGKKIRVTKELTGKIVQLENASVDAGSGEAITYVTGNLAGPVEYNTLSTAEGEASPFPLVLADGTKVWLNAASSITFPTVFNSKERMVKITGEAYLEVTHNPARPFKVEVNNQIIEDLGTSFNINSYTDEPEMKTTLIHGEVKISRGTHITYLKPGQQAVMKYSDLSIIKKAADPDQAIAWKNGDFAFEGMQLKMIMRQISRWYKVDISYQGSVAEVEFGGSISRSKNINEVLNVLQLTQGVHFKISGRRILVMP